MAVSLNNPWTTPPGLFRYRVPETGHYLKDFYAYNDLEEAIVKHYKVNGLAVPGDLRQLILDQLCQQLPAGWCRDGTASSFVGFVRGLFHEFQRIVQGTITLTDWVLAEGGKRVDDTEAIRRSERCKRCPFNQPPVGCSSCNIAVLNKVIERFLGGQSLPTDSNLEACVICGCSLKIKVRTPMEVLKRHIKPEQMMQFPPAHGDWNGCWLRDEEQHT